MFVFKPAIWKGSTLYELPRPIVSLRIQDSWDFEEFKVPLAGGDFQEGRSLNGVDISIEGQSGMQAGQLKANEGQMFAELEALRTALDPSSPEETFEMFIYHDPSSATYRSFRSCSSVRFEYDLSSPHLFIYSTLIHASDPTVYSAAPS